MLPNFESFLGTNLSMSLTDTEQSTPLGIGSK